MPIVGAAPCSCYSSWSFEPTFCVSISREFTTSPAVTESAISYYYRYLNFLSTNANGEIWDTSTTTDFDRCLPGPGDCSLSYVGGLCPSPYIEASAGHDSQSATVYCCLGGGSITRSPLTFMINPTGSYSSDDVPMCIHSWSANEPQSTLPTSSGSTPNVNIGNQQFIMRAIVMQTSISATAISTPSTSSSPGSSIPPSTITSTSPSPSSISNSLSTSTKIGIGTGATIGILVLITTIATIVYLLQRRRRQKKPKEESEQNEDFQVKDKPELHGESITEMDGRVATEIGGQAVAEMDGQTVEEMDSRAVAEIDGQVVAEIDGQAVSELATEQHLPEMPDTGLPVEADGSELALKDF